MFASIRAIGAAFLDILFPAQCAACKKLLPRRAVHPALCETCWNSIEIASGFSCPMCRRRLYDLKIRCHPEAKFILAAAADFSCAPVRELIHALKYKYVRDAALSAAELIARYSIKNNVLAQAGKKGGTLLALPIPLHRMRERQRGFNQASLILRRTLELLENKNILLEEGNLVRTRNTGSQTEQPSYERRSANIRGCFALLRPERIAGRNILLLDDVSTSGATMTEAARVLKNAGARRIVALTVARA